MSENEALLIARAKITFRPPTFAEADRIRQILIREKINKIIDQISKL